MDRPQQSHQSQSYHQQSSHHELKEAVRAMGSGRRRPYHQSRMEKSNDKDNKKRLRPPPPSQQQYIVPPPPNQHHAAFYPTDEECDEEPSLLWRLQRQQGMHMMNDVSEYDLFMPGVRGGISNAGTFSTTDTSVTGAGAAAAAAVGEAAAAAAAEKPTTHAAGACPVPPCPRAGVGSRVGGRTSVCPQAGAAPGGGGRTSVCPQPDADGTIHIVIPCPSPSQHTNSFTCCVGGGGESSTYNNNNNNNHDSDQQEYYDDGLDEMGEPISYPLHFLELEDSKVDGYPLVDTDHLSLPQHHQHSSFDYQNAIPQRQQRQRHLPSRLGSPFSDITRTTTVVTPSPKRTPSQQPGSSPQQEQLEQESTLTSVILHPPTPVMPSSSVFPTAAAASPQPPQQQQQQQSSPLSVTTPFFCSAPGGASCTIQQSQDEPEQEYFVSAAEHEQQALVAAQLARPDEAVEVVCLPTTSPWDKDHDDASSSSDTDSDSSDGEYKREDDSNSVILGLHTFDKFHKNSNGSSIYDPYAEYENDGCSASSEDDILVEIVDEDDEHDYEEDTNNNIDGDASGEHHVWPHGTVQQGQRHGARSPTSTTTPTAAGSMRHYQRCRDEAGSDVDDTDDNGNTTNPPMQDDSSSLTMDTDINVLSSSSMKMRSDPSIFVLSEHSVQLLAMQTVQEFVRAWIYQHRASKPYKRMRRSAVLLQRTYRGWKRRQTYQAAMKVMHALTTRAQRAFRRYQQRKRRTIVSSTKKAVALTSPPTATSTFSWSCLPTATSTAIEEDGESRISAAGVEEDNETHSNKARSFDDTTESSLRPCSQLRQLAVVAYDDNNYTTNQRQETVMEEELTDLERETEKDQHGTQQEDTAEHFKQQPRQQELYTSILVSEDHVDYYLDPTLEVLMAAGERLERQIGAATVVQQWCLRRRRQRVAQVQRQLQEQPKEETSLKEQQQQQQQPVLLDMPRQLPSSPPCQQKQRQKSQPPPPRDGIDKTVLSRGSDKSVPSASPGSGGGGKSNSSVNSMEYTIQSRTNSQMTTEWSAKGRGVVHGRTGPLSSLGSSAWSLTSSRSGGFPVPTRTGLSNHGTSVGSDFFSLASSRSASQGGRGSILLGEDIFNSITDWAAQRIQLIVRGKLCRRQWTRQRQASCTLQRNFRAWSVRLRGHTSRDALFTVQRQNSSAEQSEMTTAPPAPPPSSAYTARVDTLALAAERLNRELIQIAEDKKIIARLQQQAATRSLKKINSKARLGGSVIIISEEDHSQCKAESRHDDDESSAMAPTTFALSSPLVEEVQQQREQYKSRQNASRIIQRHVRGFTCRTHYNKLRAPPHAQQESEDLSGEGASVERYDYDCPMEVAEVCNDGIGQYFGPAQEKSHSSNSSVSLKSKSMPNSKNSHGSLSSFMTSSSAAAVHGKIDAETRESDQLLWAQANAVDDDVITTAAFPEDSDAILRTELHRLPQSEDTLGHKLDVVAEQDHERFDLDEDNDYTIEDANSILDTGGESRSVTPEMKEIHLPELAARYSTNLATAVRAATTIQAAWRGYWVAATYLQYMATRMIQTQWRRFAQSILYKFDLLNITLVQTAWRGRAARRLARQLRGQRLESSAKSIQTAWLSHAQRRSRAAQRIQAKWRAMYICLAYRLYIAARKVQASWRCFVQVRAYKRVAATRTVRASSRGIDKWDRVRQQRHLRAKMALRRRMSRRREIRNYPGSAATSMQAVLRGHLARVAYRRSTAARSIQATWRMFAKYRQFQLDKLNVMFVQRLWKTKVAFRQIHQMRHQLRHVPSSGARSRAARRLNATFDGRRVNNVKADQSIAAITGKIQATSCAYTEGPPTNVAAQNMHAIWHEFVLVLAYRRYKATVEQHEDSQPYFRRHRAARSIQGGWRDGRLALKRAHAAKVIQRLLWFPFRHAKAVRTIQTAWRRFFFGRWSQSLLVAVDDTEQESSFTVWNGRLHSFLDMAFDSPGSVEDEMSLSTLVSAPGKIHINDFALMDEEEEEEM